MWRPTGQSPQQELSPPPTDSSEEGYRLTPAVARRLARRNRRRTSPTPDLVTSLVRPPSPDPFYINSQYQPQPRHDGQASLGRADFELMSRGRAADLGRRSGPQRPPHPSSLDIPQKYGGACIFDLYSLVYVDEPDPNLLCPICHDPLVDPITTPCDHTFCYRCIRRCIDSSPSGTACPIDREPLTWPECFSAARLIRTQLNGLVVKCPNYIRGCKKQAMREDIETHATSECRYREYTCPDTSCDKKLHDKPKDDDCHHREIPCSYCDASIMETERDLHLLTCSKTKTRCVSCWQLVSRNQLEAHLEFDCEGVEVGCPYKDLGCPARVLRAHAHPHGLGCAFHPDTATGIVIRTQRDLIQSFGEQLQEMRERQDDAARRIEELAMLAGRRGGDDVVIHDKRTMQDLDAGFEEIHQNLTQLEARQSMWTMNQVMPIREEVTELRNNINMVRINVNWLLNRSRAEEGRMRAANSSGSATTIRRDSAGEAAPMMMERRRSSGTDVDQPRL
ncbi:hypothetical protein S40288_02057 [Stachybotrys chartarum IBT 40288]|nr:hypothetical protein S40288_02057 [Stachybotrys chartarum IBT 40288]